MPIKNFLRVNFSLDISTILFGNRALSRMFFGGIVQASDHTQMSAP